MDTSLPPGTVVAYDYLWRWQHERGEVEGRKEKPACVAISLVHPVTKQTHLVLLAISSQEPRDPNDALEIPQMECRRAGLSDLKRAWVTINEYNYDIAETSYYFDQDRAPLGRLGRAFMKQVALAIAPMMRKPSARIDRLD
jgi:hypothetical protein